MATTGTKRTKLTDNQMYYLRLIARTGMTSEHRVAKRLAARGLITIRDTKYERVEWNRVVARLSVCSLTDEGRSLIGD